MMAMELERKPLIECLESLGRGQSPTYIEEESDIFAINQKCVRNGAVDAFHSRPHNQKIKVKDSALLQDGDVCINSTGTGTIGRVGLWSSKGLHLGVRYFADSHVTIARPNREVVNPRYLAALLESAPVQTAMETYCFSGSTNQIELNRTALEALELDLIQREAQDKVATILSTLDQAIEQTEAIIAKQQRIKTGLMQDLLTKGIDENGVIRSEATHDFKDSPLGRIPVEWEVSTVGAIFTMQLGKMLSKKAVEGKSPFPYLGNKNVQWDYVDLSELLEMDFTEQERRKFELLVDDILVCEGGEVGRTALWRGEHDCCYFQKAIHRLRPIEAQYLPSLFPRFMRHAISTGALLNFTSQTSIAHLTQEQLAALPVPVPKKDEQKRIVEAFDNLDESLRIEEAMLSKMRSLKTGLMHDLLTGKVRVKS